MKSVPRNIEKGVSSKEAAGPNPLLAVFCSILAMQGGRVSQGLED